VCYTLTSYITQCANMIVTFIANFWHVFLHIKKFLTLFLHFHLNPVLYYWIGAHVHKKTRSRDSDGMHLLATVLYLLTIILYLLTVVVQLINDVNYGIIECYVVFNTVQWLVYCLLLIKCHNHQRDIIWKSFIRRSPAAITPQHKLRKINRSKQLNLNKLDITQI